jgi:hypothetical protein
VTTGKTVAFRRRKNNAFGIFNNNLKRQLLKTATKILLLLKKHIFLKKISKKLKFMLKNSDAFGIIILKYKQNCRYAPNFGFKNQGIGVYLAYIILASFLHFPV